MKIFLLFLSSLIFIIPVYSQSKITGVGDRQKSSGRTDSLQIRRYAFTLEMSKGYLSGIMITSENESGITGSLVNEFGISALDFRYEKAKEKLKLLNIAGFLNKWYIKKVLKDDLIYCLHLLHNIPYKKKGNYAPLIENDMLKIINKKYKLTYTFSPLKTFFTVESDDNATQE